MTGRIPHDAIRNAAERAEIVVCAWGVSGEHDGRARWILELLAPYRSKLRAFGTTKNGHPKHPLYLRNDSQLVRFEEASA